MKIEVFEGDDKEIFSYVSNVVPRIGEEITFLKKGETFLVTNVNHVVKYNSMSSMDGCTVVHVMVTKGT